MLLINSGIIISDFSELKDWVSDTGFSFGGYTNLMYNGDAELGNTSFVNAQGVSTQYPFEGVYNFVDSGYRQYSGNAIEVNPYNQYIESVYYRFSGVPSGTYSNYNLAGFACFDQDANYISYAQCGGNNNDYLAQDVNPGDQFVYVKDINSWPDVGSLGANVRYLLFYPPNDTKYFKPHYYTRYGNGDFTLYYSNRDTVSGRLRLSTDGTVGGNTTWPTGRFSSGTPINRGVDAATYNYALSSTLTTGWQRNQTVINSLGSYYDSTSGFRPGTKYIAYLNLSLYYLQSDSNINSLSLHTDKIVFANLTDPSQSIPGYNHISGNRKSVSVKSGILYSNSINEIVPPTYASIFKYGREIITGSSLLMKIDPEHQISRAGLSGFSNSIYAFSGTTLRDLTNNGNNLTINGFPYMGSGTFSGRGVTEHLFRNHFSWQGFFTFGIWIKTQSGVSNNGVYWFNESDRVNSGGYRIACDFTVSGGKDYLRFNGSDNSNSINSLFGIQSNIQINDGKWHYATCVWDSGRHLASLYTDGVLDNFITISGNDGGYASMQIGGSTGILGTTSINGHLGAMHFYNRALTNEEIYYNYYHDYHKRYRFL